MRLLEKHELDQRKAQERKSEIDEGVKLSRKVDELRRLEADEKARITSWRDGLLSTVKQEIEQAVKERDGLRSECKTLTERNAKLREPLDAEWEQVRQEKSSINGLKQGLLEEQDALAEQKQQVESEARELEVEKGRIADLKHTTTEKLVQADKALSEAREESADMRNRAQTVLSKAELNEKLLTERELKVAIRERDVDNKYSNVEAYEARLFVKEQYLKDLEQTLLATKKELDGESNTKRSTKKGR